MSRNFVLPCEIPFKIAKVANLPDIGIQVTKTHAVSHPIETEHKVPHRIFPLTNVAL